MLIVFISMLIAAITLLVLSITGAIFGKWTRSLICFFASAVMIVTLLEYAKHYHKSIKIRAKEYALTHPKTVQQKVKTETENTSNQVSEATSEPAPSAASSSPQD